MTLLEVLVVITLLALMASAMTSLSWQPSGSLAGTERAIINTLRSARIQAIEERRSVGVLFDLEARRFGIGTPDQVLPTDIDIVIVSAAEVAQQATNRPGFNFLADGSATGGRILLKQANEQRSLSIDWITGRVRRAGHAER